VIVVWNRAEGGIRIPGPANRTRLPKYPAQRLRRNRHCVAQAYEES
jgi:hypothetical protein